MSLPVNQTVPSALNAHFVLNLPVRPNRGYEMQYVQSFILLLT
jgi:hypothetical protein